MSQIVKYKVFGKATRPTIYYLIGFGSRISQYRAHIAALKLAGFRIFAFEYDNAILQGGDPTLLPEALQYICKVVAEDKKNHPRVAGIYGVSLGAILGRNLAIDQHIDKGLFNSGGASILEPVWELPNSKARAAFEKAGYDKSTIAKHWRGLDAQSNIQGLKGKTFLLLASDTDEVLSHHEAVQNVRAWQHAGSDAMLVTTGSRKHGPMIARNMFRLRQTIAFFRQP